MFNTSVFYLTVTKAAIFLKLSEIHFDWKISRNSWASWNIVHFKREFYVVSVSDYIIIYG